MSQIHISMETRNYLNYSFENKEPRLALAELFLTFVEQVVFSPSSLKVHRRKMETKHTAASKHEAYSP